MNDHKREQNHSSESEMKRMKQSLKDVELRIVVELMKNSRRSDRELAKAVGVSQPTVSRTIEKLEKSGVIKEYTMIPDFHRLGYQIMGATRFELSEEPFKDRAKARGTMVDTYPALMAVEGIGKGSNRLFVGFYKDYSEYAKAMEFLRTIPIISANNIDTFMVDLSNEKNYRILSMSSIATNLLNRLNAREHH